MYGSHSELAERNIDTTQLLGLIHQKENDERNNFVAVDSDEEDGKKCRISV